MLIYITEHKGITIRHLYKIGWVVAKTTISGRKNPKVSEVRLEDEANLRAWYQQIVAASTRPQEFMRLVLGADGWEAAGKASRLIGRERE